MFAFVKLFILIIFVTGVFSMDNTTVGDLPDDIRDQFIDIVVKGIVYLVYDCSEPANTFDVKLLLYTRTYRDVPITLDPNNPYQIDVTKKVKIVIHGWMGGSTSYGIPELKEAYLNRYDCNVIVVDWSALATQLYTTCYCDLPDIGMFVAEFLCNFSDQSEVPMSEVHLIGHSLGAQMAGFAGTYTKQICNQQIGRITGLDPAGPIYQLKGPSNRLDRSDAIFVDVIHSNEGIAGYYGQCGHVDFHVNCGTFQTGITDPSDIPDLDSASLSEVAGSHVKSLDYMAESINSDAFKAKSCRLCPLLCITDFLNPSFITMGEDCPSNPATVNYYVPTSSSPPYALGCDPYHTSNCT